MIIYFNDTNDIKNIQSKFFFNDTNNDLYYRKSCLKL